MASQVDGDISGERKLAAVGHLLNRRHDGRFMVWNLSEVDYDVDVLDDQVLSFTFAGSPSPPLGLLLKLLVSMESWLKADDRNVAVVHCLTGKGRTSAVLAAFLCWMGQAQFADVFDALNYIAQCKQVSVDELTIPSQRRYASYFKNMLDGVRPSQPPLMLKRVIMSEAPRFAKGPPRPPPPSSNNNNNSEMETDETQLFGCVPYLQIFKAGALLHTAPASLHYQQPVNELPFCQVADGNISFHVNLVIQGDILVRARHLTHNKKRVSMFRAAFHTGYTPPNVMRFTKAQLDGACSDDRFAPDFFLDFIFEPVDAEEASKLLNDDAGNNKNKPYETSAADATTTASSDKRKANAVEASADDTMLHRDSRFWEVIATRMKENAAETVKQEDPMWGPTVGRRRDFSIKDDGTGQAETNATTSEQARNALETFSIGGEFDFLPEITEPGKPIALATAVAAPKKDSLMEALMGALDDDMHDHEADKEETVEFDTGDSPSLSAVQSNSESADESLKLSDKPSELQEESIHGGSSSVDKESNATPAVDDVQALLADANINLDGMDALLAEAGGTDFEEDDDMLNFDVDDEDLKDLEHFLSPSST